MNNISEAPQFSTSISENTPQFSTSVRAREKFGASVISNASGPAGPEGPPGPQGPPGADSTVPGPQGPAGPQGALGPTGATGATGPHGDPGPLGPQGSTGATGSKGDPGTTGPTGPQGTPGTTGATGPAGAQGPQGVAGTGVTIKGSVSTAANLPPTGNATGDAWITTDTGHLWTWDGTHWVDGGNITGPPGPQGTQGTTGPPGPQGVHGVDGPTGPPGAQGAQGTTGSQGIQGPQGTPGATGPQGATGATGTAGASGPQGVPGTDGALGPQGPKGDKGDTGAIGPQGNPGVVIPATPTVLGGVKIGANVSVAGDGTISVAGPALPPGGSGANSQIIYNALGNFGGNSGFVFNALSTFVGIGTGTPDAPLTISQNVSAPAWGGPVTLHLVGVDGGTPELGLDAFGTGGPTITARAAAGTNAAKSPLVTNAFLLNLRGMGYGGPAGYSTSARARIAFFASQNWSDTAQGAYIQFNVTGNNTASNFEAMRIDQSGYVGIGSGTPAVALEVSNRNIAPYNLYLSGIAPSMYFGAVPGIQPNSGAGQLSAGVIAFATANGQYQGSAGDLLFITQSWAAGNSNSFRFMGPSNNAGAYTQVAGISATGAVTCYSLSASNSISSPSISATNFSGTTVFATNIAATNNLTAYFSCVVVDRNTTANSWSLYSAANRFRIFAAGSMGINNVDALFIDGTTGFTGSPYGFTCILGGAVCSLGYPVINAPADGTNYAGIWYDGSNQALRMEGLLQGVAWRNVCLSPIGGNVGIGTLAPGAKLHIITANNAAPTDQFVIGEQSNNPAYRLSAGYYLNGGSAWTGFIQATNSTPALGKLVLQPLGGNVGIGVGAPGVKLDVVSNDNTPSGGGLRIYPLNLTQNATYSFGGITSTYFYSIQSGAGQYLALNPGGGNVGIGTAAPAALLHVAGQTRISSGGYLRIDDQNTANPWLLFSASDVFRFRNYSGQDQFWINGAPGGVATFNCGIVVNGASTVNGTTSVYGPSGQLRIYDQSTPNFWNVYSTSDTLRVVNYGGSEIFNVVAVGGQVTFNYGVTINGALTVAGALNLSGSVHTTFFDSQYILSGAYYNGANWIYRGGASAMLFNTDPSYGYLQVGPNGAAGTVVPWTQSMRFTPTLTTMAVPILMQLTAFDVDPSLMPYNSIYFIPSGEFQLIVRMKAASGTIRQATLNLG